MKDLIPLLVIVGAGGWAVFRLFFRKVIVFEYERGVFYQRGCFARVLAAGRHWYPRLTGTVHKVDMRLRVVTIPGQEVLTSDNITIRISLMAQYEIADPAIAINRFENFQETLYMTVQGALRDVVSAAKIDELIEKRKEIGPRLLQATEGPAREMGLALKSVSVKDITFPGDLKKIFAQVVKAQKEGLAALERARGETAALRNLANAARMIEDNPALMQLRTLQTVGEGTGNTIVVGMPPTTPLPVKGSGSTAARKPDPQTGEEER